MKSLENQHQTLTMINPVVPTTCTNYFAKLFGTCNNISMTTGKPTDQKAKALVAPEDLVSVPQAAKRLGRHCSTVYRWIYTGKIVPVRIGNQVFITVDVLKILKEVVEHQKQIRGLEQRLTTDTPEPEEVPG